MKRIFFILTAILVSDLSAEQVSLAQPDRLDMVPPADVRLGGFVGRRVDVNMRGILLHKDEYATPKKPVFVGVGKAQYLAIAGQGAPGQEAYIESIGALYAMAYTIKMTRKFAGETDYVVGKLEAQTWADEENADFSTLPSEQWRWRLMIRTPDFIKKRDLTEARAKLLEKGKAEAVKEVVLTSFAEGKCVQMLHVGPYQKEGETVAKMHAILEQEGYEVSGRHHEVYLSDPRRVAPEKLRTILRQPVRRKR